MFNLDNLPGVISQVNDYNLGNIKDSDGITTESVLILGTAVDGPTGIPMGVGSVSDALALFGDFKDASGNPNGATLVRGIIEAYKAGCRDIRAMRITGKKAFRAAVDDKGNAYDNIITNGDLYNLRLEARFEGSIYNSVYCTFDNVGTISGSPCMTIYKPASKLTDLERKSNTTASGSTLVPTVFKYADFGLNANSPLADFIRQVNNHVFNNVLTLKIVDASGSDLTNSLDPNARALKISDLKSLNDAGDKLVNYYISGGADEISLPAIETYKRLGGYLTSYTLGVDGTVTTGSIDSTAVAGYENSVYELLANYRVDNIVLMEGFADTDICVFRDANGNAKLNVTSAEFLQKIPAGRPYVNITNTAAVTDSAGHTILKAGSVVGRIRVAATDLPHTLKTTVTISAPASTGSITMVENTAKDGFDITIVPPTGTANLVSLFNFINGYSSVIYTPTSGTPLYVKDVMYTERWYDVSYYKEVPALTKTTVSFGGYAVYSTTDNFARQLAQACAVISSRSQDCIGMIGCSAAPATDLVSVKNYVNYLLGRKTSNAAAIHVASLYDLYLKTSEGGKMFGSSGKPIDIGGYINIVAAPEIVYADGVLGAYAASGAATYGGVISTLPAEYSTTNRVASGGVILRYDLSAQQLNDLTGAGYVTFRTNYDKSIVITDGVTAAGLSSDFQRLTTKRITNAAMHVVKKVCEPFIGLPNNLAQRNALTTAIQAGLDGMKQAGAIQDAQFEVYSSKRDQVLGNALIDLTIIPVFEFRKIKVYVNLKAPS